MRFLLSLGAPRRKLAPPHTPHTPTVLRTLLALVHDDVHPALRAQREADGADLRREHLGRRIGLYLPTAANFDEMIIKARHLEKNGGCPELRFERSKTKMIIGVSLFDMGAEG
jgi:hypothetical protein